MTDPRWLIVNADDFGQSPGVNRGIIEAFECGIVTSASLMVRGAAAPDAAAYSRAQPGLGVGIHLDLGEWTHREGGWQPIYEVVPLHSPSAVAEEVSRQLDTFHRLVGIDPMHIDFHQHFHLREPVRSVALELARTIGVPLRHYAARIRYCGAFYGQTAEGQPRPDWITPEALVRVVEALEPGVTELACHPGYAEDLRTMYRTERAQEIKALCDPRVRAALVAGGIELCSFHKLAPRPGVSC